jgi:hypothetical protein
VDPLISIVGENQLDKDEAEESSFVVQGGQQKLNMIRKETVKQKRLSMLKPNENKLDEDEAPAVQKIRHNVKSIW